MSKQLQSLQSSLKSAVEAQAAAQGGTLGLDEFVWIIFTDGKKWAREKLDTEEERDALIAYGLSLADQVVAARFPVVWPIVRKSLEALLDEAIDNVPILLAASPPPSDPNTSIA